MTAAENKALREGLARVLTRVNNCTEMLLHELRKQGDFALDFNTIQDRAYVSGELCRMLGLLDSANSSLDNSSPAAMLSPVPS